ncbi:hypothetical protein LUZ61_016826 [Rhynchospora tenuis]|uniref:Uncharacterized protein n=1 Tax=Rhynchospora tenuis TaxID=198213 RepID=A0AAD6EKE3_9POAL|nr:hypothetical protein LUZ61_016826 [Rhynchospora tenuis]
MDWHSDGKDCMDILAMSYKDMPYTLKACFLYLSSFPEDFELSAKYLIRMWIAEGFIPQNDKKTMEETAEDYLEQLFHRSMVQVLRRSSTSGLIKYCRIHDLIRELAMHKAAEENFVTFFPKPQGANHPHLATRRASLQLCNPQSVENVGKNTRSLLWFGLRDNLPNYSEYRLIRVLEIEGVKMSHVIELRGLEQLIHLKYLGFRNCEGLSISTCPFGRLRNLETLDLRGILMPYGPSTGLWTIRTLRHVLYNECFSSDIPAKADLRNLQTLQWISSIETWKTNELPRLDNLRKLGFSNGDTGHWDAASDLFGVLPSLISLHIKAGFQNEIPLKIVYPSALPNYKNLQNLHLDGKWPDSVTLEARLFPHHLIKLTLIDSELGQDPMLELGKLESLMKLRLEGFAYNEKQMICPRGFPVLQSLVLKLGGLTILTVEKGVMPKLRNLTKSYHIKLDLPLELNHLTYNYLLD